MNHKLKFLLSYFVSEVLGNNLETLVRYSTLYHCRTKWTKDEILMVVLVKYIILKKIKISVQGPFNHAFFIRVDIIILRFDVYIETELFAFFFLGFLMENYR